MQNLKIKIKIKSKNKIPTSTHVTKGEIARIAGLTAWDKKATGPNACIISTFKLYSGFRDDITKNAVVPCEWAIYCNFVCPVLLRTKSIDVGISIIPISCQEKDQNSFRAFDDPYGFNVVWLVEYTLPRLFKKNMNYILMLTRIFSLSFLPISEPNVITFVCQSISWKTKKTYSVFKSIQRKTIFKKMLKFYHQPSAWFGPDNTKDADESNKPCWTYATFFPFAGGDFSPPVMRCNCKM